MIIELKQENFNEEMKDGLVLVDFHAHWCGPCKMMHPVIEEISQANPSLKIIKVDIDHHEELARKYAVMSIPTLMIFQDGNLVEKNVGFVSKEVLDHLLKKYI